MPKPCPFEAQLATHCAAVLASCKIANYYCTDECAALDQNLDRWNRMFEEQRIRFQKVCACRGRCGVLVYREDALTRRLEDPEARAILKAAGYRDLSLEGALETLAERLSLQRARGTSCTFPHEIGVFLGYPLLDVTLYIRNKGQHSLCSGAWKVYHDVKAAKRCFDQYKKCRELLLAALERGLSLKASLATLPECP